jgi:SagB-type dehydrogenase family enzyme
MTGKGALMALAGGLLLAAEPAPPAPEPIALPRAAAAGTMSVEQALAERRSVRAYSADPLTLEQVSQILWAAQGITDAHGHRTAPSAGALYPLELLLVAGEVTGLPAGVYRYRPAGHALVRLAEGDRRRALAAAAGGQEWVNRGAAVIVAAGVPRRTAARYGARAARYVHIEAGHAGQNVYLQATALGLGTVMVGAFDDGAVGRAVGLAAGEEPLWLMPVGRPAARR